jgi:Dyp-type peroxidase family
MQKTFSSHIKKEERDQKEEKENEEKVRQPGISRPAASKQRHLLIIRLDLSPPKTGFPVDNPKNPVREGVKRLCRLFERIYEGHHKIHEIDDIGDHVVDHLVELSKYNFSATIGFGLGFFKKMDIKENKRPKNLRDMPDHHGQGDPTPYSMGQTDLIIQLGSSSDFVNHWVLENSIQPPHVKQNTISKLQQENLETPDIVSAVSGWAVITDVSAGFQRVDNRNLQGFNDGVSNPRRLTELFDKIVWTIKGNKEDDDNFKDGTYMVFQKIEHDLDQWRALELDEQEEWVGRSKGTGLLLGTLKEEEDRELGKKLSDPTIDAKIRKEALKELNDKHFNSEDPEHDQSNPETRFFDHKDPNDPNSPPKHGEIPLKCPAWAHVRKANPRQEDDLFNAHLIFRRGYPYMEKGSNEKIRSGLLFVCFQNNIDQGFEFIKKRWFNSKNFPVPSPRPNFTNQEIAKRHSQGRFTLDELENLLPQERKLLGLENQEDFDKAIKEAQNEDTQNTGREGLAGPSELGVITTGEFLATIPLGGGYYFVPPIPNKKIANIGEQFF